MTVLIFVRGTEPGVQRNHGAQPVRCMNNTAWVFATGGGVRVPNQTLYQYAEEWLHLEDTKQIVACADEAGRPVVSLRKLLVPVEPAPVAPVVPPPTPAAPVAPPSTAEPVAKTEPSTDTTPTDSMESVETKTAEKATEDVVPATTDAKHKPVQQSKKNR